VTGIRSRWLREFTVPSPFYPRVQIVERFRIEPPFDHMSFELRAGVELFTVYRLTSGLSRSAIRRARS
jgi:hypothetical protein